jgi:hypothetical protein
LLLGYVLGSRDEGELVPKLVWRVKLLAKWELGLTMEAEVSLASSATSRAAWQASGSGSRMQSGSPPLQAELVRVVSRQVV